MKCEERVRGKQESGCGDNGDAVCVNETVDDGVLLIEAVSSHLSRPRDQAHDSPLYYSKVKLNSGGNRYTL